MYLVFYLRLRLPHLNSNSGHKISFSRAIATNYYKFELVKKQYYHSVWLLWTDLRFLLQITNGKLWRKVILFWINGIESLFQLAWENLSCASIISWECKLIWSLTVSSKLLIFLVRLKICWRHNTFLVTNVVDSMAKWSNLNFSSTNNLLTKVRNLNKSLHNHLNLMNFHLSQTFTNLLVSILTITRSISLESHLGSERYQERGKSLFVMIFLKESLKKDILRAYIHTVEENNLE